MIKPEKKIHLPLNRKERKFFFNVIRVCHIIIIINIMIFNLLFFSSKTTRIIVSWMMIMTKIKTIEHFFFVNNIVRNERREKKTRKLSHWNNFLVFIFFLQYFLILFMK